MLITKRCGATCQFSRDKLSRTSVLVTDGLKGVSANQLTLNTVSEIVGKRSSLTSRDLQLIMIDSALRLSEDMRERDVSSEYSVVAARIFNNMSCKDAYDAESPTSLYQHVKEMVGKRLYKSCLIERFKESDWNQIETLLNKRKRQKFEYDELVQCYETTCIKLDDRYVETPDVALIVSCAAIMINEKKRLLNIEKAYKLLSSRKLVLPPNVIKVIRSDDGIYSSGAIMDTADSLRSINHIASEIVNFSSIVTPVCVNTGRIRSSGEGIKNGMLKHAGVLPIQRYFHAAMEACVGRNGLGNDALFFTPFWHKDLLTILEDRGDSRLSQLTHCIQANKLFYQRILADAEITLFSPSVSPVLYSSFLKDYNMFVDCYTKLENEHGNLGIKISARELYKKIVIEASVRKGVYVQNVDWCNTSGAFLQTRTEIGGSDPSLVANIPSVSNGQAEIGQLVRAKISIDLISKPDKGVLIDVLNVLDNLIDLQCGTFNGLSKDLCSRRCVGITLLDFDKIITNHTASELHNLVEKMQYHLMSASIELAKQKGACDKFKETKYAAGVLPHERMSKKILNKIGQSNKLNWEQISLEVQKHGMRNSTLTSGVDRYENKTSVDEDQLLKASIVQKFFDNNVVVNINSNDVLADMKMLLSAYTSGIRSVRLR